MTGESLLAGAAMHRNQGGSRLDHAQGELGGIDREIRPADPLLDRDGDGCRQDGAHSADDGGCQRWLAHERGAACARRDFARGTPHVDVHHPRADLSRHRCCARQHLWLATNNLDAEAPATQAGPHAPQDPFRPAGEGFSRQEFGEGQGRAMLFADGAERQVCHRLHWREQGARADLDGADMHGDSKP